MYDIHVGLSGTTYPFGNFSDVGHGGGEEYQLDVRWQHDDDFLPHHAPAGVLAMGNADERACECVGKRLMQWTVSA